MHSVCLSIVEKQQPIAKDQLESVVKQQLSGEHGFSLNGVGLLIARCLASESFQIADDGRVSLAGVDSMQQR